MDFGEIGVGFLRSAVLVKGLIPVTALLGDIPQRKMQGAIVGIAFKQSGNDGFSYIELFVADSPRGSGERSGANIGRGSLLGPA